MRFNVPPGANAFHGNFNSQASYIPFNLAALSAMSNQQLEDLINQGREKVVEATNNVTGARIQPLEDIISSIWKKNLTLSEAQVQALALSRQASQELDVKRREAIYNDVLTKQQMVKRTLETHWFAWISWAPAEGKWGSLVKALYGNL
nr:PREDICTED: transcriptional regulator ATRX-like [Anolis carolinensis]|eukprot:XP_008123786.2 PREDICTED: transcriptional regulator ATRX-like [Anolis carolinensis]